MISTYAASDVPAPLWSALVDLHDTSDVAESPFFHPAFAKSVATHRDDVVIVVASEGGEPATFWPMHSRPGRWARPIGGPFSNWHGPVSRRGAKTDVRQLLADGGFQGLTGHGFVACEGHSWPTLARETANLSDVSGDWDTFLSERTAEHKSSFKKLRRHRRNLERDFGPITFTADNRDTAAFDTLVSLKRQQFVESGRHDVLAAGWVERWLKQLWGEDRSGVHARLSTLSVDGRFVAGEFNLASPRLVHGWIAGIDRSFGRYSPGHLLVESILEDQSRNGPQLYDAGTGIDRHKTIFANVQRPLGTGTVRSGRGSWTPQSLLRRGWAAMEAGAPGRISATLQKVRRRTDQIVATEVDFDRTLSGFISAARQLSRPAPDAPAPPETPKKETADHVG